MTRLVRDLTRAIPQPLDAPNTMGELWQTDPTGPSRMWSALDNVGSLRWDSIVFGESFAASDIPFEVIIAGPTDSATFTSSMKYVALPELSITTLNTM